jgi:uncharacterized membrane protein
MAVDREARGAPASRRHPVRTTSRRAGATSRHGTRRRRWARLRPGRYAYAGLLPAVVLGGLSLTPSLLPRGPLFQGIVAGLVACCGYAVGVVARPLLGAVVRPRLPGRARRPAGVLLMAGGVVLAGFLLWRWLPWQVELHLRMDREPPGAWARPAIVAVSIAVFVAVIGAARLVRAGGRLVGFPLRRLLPTTAATTVGAAVVLVALGAAADRYLVGATLSAVDRSFDAVNNNVPAGLEAPRSWYRSGTPESLSPWSQLGVQGRRLVATGPTTSDLVRATDGPVAQPIRVYAGLDTSEDLDALTDLAVRELERTGGFDRAVLCVTIPTGRGWVNARAVAPLEYLHAGDTAIVAVQYSYLPSPLSFLVNPERAKDAGRALFEAVYARWSELPEGDRPRLVVFGESLGSTGIQAAFSGLADLRARTDGALLVGPPESNTLVRDLTERRDAGSREIVPQYDGGLTVRFAAEPDDLSLSPFAWPEPRVVVVQNPSDPIVWWSTDLLFQQPDWLRERRGDDVSPDMRWYPLVTFFQVTADMAVSGRTPVGHGHRYADFLDYWAAIVPPPGWTQQDTDDLEARIP